MEILICRNGEVAQELRNFQKENELNNLVYRLKTADLSRNFSKLPVFVSRIFKNFPSMSMMMQWHVKI